MMGGAALWLACKITDQYRSLDKVVKACRACSLGKQGSAAAKKRALENDDEVNIYYTHLLYFLFHCVRFSDTSVVLGLDRIGRRLRVGQRNLSISNKSLRRLSVLILSLSCLMNLCTISLTGFWVLPPSFPFLFSLYILDFFSTLPSPILPSLFPYTHLIVFFRLPFP
jgi:hypothetical protein